MRKFNTRGEKNFGGGGNRGKRQLGRSRRSYED
jgi:hypothetical protein